MSTSARTGHNVKEIFKTITERKSKLFNSIGIAAKAGGSKKKKIKNRGGFDVDGYDANEEQAQDSNIFDKPNGGNNFRLTSRESMAVKNKKAEKKKGCC